MHRLVAYDLRRAAMPTKRRRRTLRKIRTGLRQARGPAPASPASPASPETGSRRRFGRREAGRAALAVVLLVSCLLVARRIVSGDVSPLRAGEPAIALTGLPAITANTSYAAQVSLSVDGCDRPVRATARFALPAEYWQRTGDQLAGEHTIRIAVSPPVSDLQVAALPAGATYAASMSFNHLSASTAPSLAGFTAGPTITTSHYTVASAVMSDWPRTLLVLVATFSARWTRADGYGRCVLGIPSLTTEGGTSYADGLAATVSDVPKTARPRPRAAAIGGTVIDFAPGLYRLSRLNGEVLDTQHQETCDGVDTLTELLDSFTGHGATLQRGRDAFAFSLAALKRNAVPVQHTHDCGDTLVLTERNAGSHRDLWLLVLGALLGLAVTLLGDVALRLMRHASP